MEEVYKKEVEKYVNNWKINKVPFFRIEDGTEESRMNRVIV